MDNLEDLLIDAAEELRHIDMISLAAAVDQARVKLSSRADVPPESGTRLCISPTASYGVDVAQGLR